MGKQLTNNNNNNNNNNNMDEIDGNSDDNMNIRVYTRRWFLLGLFMMYASTVGMPWMQFASITGVVADYYHVSRSWVEYTSVMVMAARAFLLVPALFLMDKLGTKKTLLLGSILCLIGSGIKIFSVSPERFYVAFIGQIFSAFALVCTYSLIGRFSSAWFSSDEISRAGALSCVGETIGCAVGFLLPSLFVPNEADIAEVERGMLYMHYFYTACALVTTTLIVIFFKSKPKSPPSAAQAHFRSQKSQHVYKSVKKLLDNTNFLMFVASQGLFVGCGSNAVGTLLNEMIETNFPGQALHTGTLGCFNLSCGILGSVVLGYIQDRTRKFKCVALGLSAANCVTLGLFTIAMKMDKIMYVYVTYAIFGFLMQGYYATTIQMGIELTFPVPEGITVAATSVCVEMVSMTATFCYGLAMKSYGDLRTNICATFLLFLSTLVVCVVPPDFKREEIENATKAAEEKGLLCSSEKRLIVTSPTMVHAGRPTS